MLYNSFGLIRYYNFSSLYATYTWHVIKELIKVPVTRDYTRRYELINLTNFKLVNIMKLYLQCLK